VDRAVTEEVFREYTRQHLAAALRLGDIVAMDNPACHKVAGVADAIRAAGAEMVYQPPYSPDLNPIEQAFSKVKGEIR
jgi:transposase